MWHALIIEVLPGKHTTIVFDEKMPAQYIFYQLMHGIERVLEGVAPHEDYLPGDYPLEEDDMA